MIYNKKAQSIIEYVVIFMIVAAAIFITHKYVYRSMMGRMEEISEELNKSMD
jgi:large-conductance mechanosensitive channel